MEDVGNLKVNRKIHKKNCLHNSCQFCKGTFSKADGSLCRHSYKCTCQSCMELERIFYIKNKKDQEKYV